MSENFYLDVLPPGQPITATILGKGKDTQITHQGHTDVADLPAHFSTITQQNAYFALGTYPDMEPGSLFKPVENNLLGEPVGGRAWAFDLDVGQGEHKYSTLEEAADAISERVSDGRILDPSWIVFTGGGLQFYYVLPEGELLSPERWKYYQLRLKEYMREVFRVDATDPESPSKIDPKPGSQLHTWFRAPNTLNFNHGNPVQTAIIHEGQWHDEETIADLIRDVQLSDGKRDNKQHKRSDSRLSAYDRVTGETLISACGFVRKLHETQGAYPISEPDWCMLANLTGHTLAMDTLFHECSQAYDHRDDQGRHFTYDYKEAEDKYTSIYNNTSAGPFGCDQLEDQSQCSRCWVRQNDKITNPISAARHWEKFGVQIFKDDAPPSPPPEKKKKKKSQADIVKDTEQAGMPEEVEYAFDPAKAYALAARGLEQFSIGENDRLLYQGKDIGDLLMSTGTYRNEFTDKVTIRVGKPGKVAYPIKGELLGSPLRLSSYLTSIGFRCRNREQMAIWLQAAYDEENYKRECIGMGWHDDFQGFYAPGQTLLGDEVFASQPVTQIARKWYGREGEVNDWVEAIQLLNNPAQSHALITLLVGLGAPLLSYLNLNKGAMYALHGPPGVGKTTSMQLVNSVWGKSLDSLARFSDTDNALPKLVAVTHHLPVTVDEYTHIDPKVLQQWSMDITQGEYRNRLDENTNFRETDMWQTIFMTTGNRSYRDIINGVDNMSGADLSRVYEVKMNRQNDDLEAAENMRHRIGQCYGTFGEVFIQELARQDQKQLQNEAHDLRQRLRREGITEGDDRYSEDIVIIAYFAHRIAKKAHPEFPGSVRETHRLMVGYAMASRERLRLLLAQNTRSVDDFILFFEANEGIVKPDKTQKDPDFNTKSKHCLHGYLYDIGTEVIVPLSTLQRWCDVHRLDSEKILEAWQSSNQLFRTGGSDDYPQYRTTAGNIGKFKVNGRSMGNTNIILIRRSQNVVDMKPSLRKRKRTTLKNKLKSGEKL